MTDIEAYMLKLGSQARSASRQIGKATTAQKNSALLAIAEAIHLKRDQLLAANQLDLAAGREKALESALMDRLELTKARIDAMLEGLRQVAAAVSTEGGQEAMRLRIAEEYVEEFGKLAQSSNTLVLPANLSDIGSMITLATSIFSGASDKPQPTIDNRGTA